MNRKAYRPKFSVIIPVFNTEKYIAETLESIIRQSIGFKKNVEIILVDDGSSDSSPEICKKYQNKYPHNIKYIRQKNKGPAVARDVGASNATGKYLSFPDSDDKLSRNAFKKVYSFFEKHYDEIDIVTIPWEYFEARIGGDHPLNDKFYRDRIVDLTKNYTEIVGSVAPSFFKKEVFEKHKSSPKVGKYSEDLRFMGQALLDKQRYGIVCSATYYYRKRESQTSSQDGNTLDLFWYLETPKTAIIDLLKYAKDKYGNIPKFIQFLAMYDLQWRIKRFGDNAISLRNIAKYQKLLISIIKQIDEDIIVAVRNISPEVKIFILDLKNDFKKRSIKQSGDNLHYNNIRLPDTYRGGSIINIDFIKRHGKKVIIEANYLGLADDVSLRAVSGSRTYKPKELVRKPNILKVFLDRRINYPSRGYIFEIPLSHLINHSLEFYVNFLDKPLSVSTRRFTGLSNNKYAYVVKQGFIVEKKEDKIFFKNNRTLWRILYELRYMFFLLFRFNISVIYRLPRPEKLKRRMMYKNDNFNRFESLKYNVLLSLSLPFIAIESTFRNGLQATVSNYIMPFIHQIWANIYSVFFRTMYYITAPYYFNKNIWLFMDRTFEADDSAEILFEYVINQNNPNVTPIFTIKKDAPDFTRLSKIGKTIPFLSQYQKLLFLHSKKVISSHADDIIINPFQGLVNDLLDLYRFDYVFLQHGIIKDDISDWLNRYNKNIKLFVTSVIGEYQSILDYQYFYDESVVKLTGLPRYDKLDNKPENKIALAPTWRQHLAIDVADADRGHAVAFKETYYYKYYQSFISDNRLNEALEKHNLTMQFYIHPSFKAQYIDFKPGKSVQIKKLPYDYKKVKSVSKLMITDFSSVVFDFAYLRKPIIYGQFDEDIFWKMHMSRPGYFSYRKNGLGPVTTDLTSTVDKIIEYIENDFKLEKKYKNRIEKFFAFDDNNNSKRVYKEILKLDKQEKH